VRGKFSAPFELGLLWLAAGHAVVAFGWTFCILNTIL